MNDQHPLGFWHGFWAGLSFTWVPGVPELYARAHGWLWPNGRGKS